VIAAPIVGENSIGIRLAWRSFQAAIRHSASFGTGRVYPVNAVINGGASWIDYILTAAALAAAIYALWVYKNIER
jgi:hypothetical protein